MGRILNTLELCILYKVQRPVVEKWRGNGLPFVKEGNLFYYDSDVVMRWIAERRNFPQRFENKKEKPKERLRLPANQ